MALRLILELNARCRLERIHHAAIAQVRREVGLQQWSTAALWKRCKTDLGCALGLPCGSSIVMVCLYAFGNRLAIDLYLQRPINGKLARCLVQAAIRGFGIRPRHGCDRKNKLRPHGIINRNL